MQCVCVCAYIFLEIILMVCFWVKEGGKEERDEERMEDSDGGAG